MPQYVINVCLLLDYTVYTHAMQKQWVPFSETVNPQAGWHIYKHPYLDIQEQVLVGDNKKKTSIK